MKKILAITLALVMMLAMSVPVFAADDDATGSAKTPDVTIEASKDDTATEDVVENQASTDVIAKLDTDGDGIPDDKDTDDDNDDIPDDKDDDDDPSAAIVIAVDIYWGDTTFTYTPGAIVYDPVTMTETTQAGKWDETVRTMQIDNRSNVDIDAMVSFKIAFSKTGEREADGYYHAGGMGVAHPLAFSLNADMSDYVYLNDPSGATSKCELNLPLAMATKGEDGENGTATTGYVYYGMKTELEGRFQMYGLDEKTDDTSIEVTGAKIGTITVTITKQVAADPTPTPVEPYVVNYNEGDYGMSNTIDNVPVNRDIKLNINQVYDLYEMNVEQIECEDDSVTFVETNIIRFSQTGSFKVTLKTFGEVNPGSGPELNGTFELTFNVVDNIQ